MLERKGEPKRADSAPRHTALVARGEFCKTSHAVPDSTGACYPLQRSPSVASTDHLDDSELDHQLSIRRPRTRRSRCQHGLRLGEQGGDMLPHVHRGEEIVGGDHGVYENRTQVRSQVCMQRPVDVLCMYGHRAVLVPLRSHPLSSTTTPPNLNLVVRTD